MELTRRRSASVRGWLALLPALAALTAACYVFPAELPDPCRDRRCPYGARCVPAPDGRSASCECPRRCPLYGDHQASRPVCGQDGVDYRDQCELRRAACAASKEVAVRFHGKCDPCQAVTCSEPEVCQLDGDRNPVCRCGDTCSLEFTPVCGSDGKTYSNECVLRQESCRSRRALRIIYRGKCSSGVNPCSSLRCAPGQECAISKYGIAECACPPDCEPVMRPACGDDGRTYDSACEMRRQACLEKREARVAYSGPCGGTGPCAGQRCDHGGTCVEREGQAVCECPSCSAEFDPVCGSDGISYGNECRLRLEACQHSRQIRVLYRGLCNGCENKKCDFYAVCESDGTDTAKCVCPEKCPEAYAPVCGTDGNTYNNECELRVSSCRNSQFVVLAYKGDCDLCENVVCKFGARCEAGECVCPTNCSTGSSEPVCASNMVTYPSECELQRASCLLPVGVPPLAVIFYGECREKFGVALTTATSPTLRQTARPGEAPEQEACRDIHCYYDATCELGPDNFPRCSCRFNCSHEEGESEAVCASDLRMYPSACAMRMEGCQRQEELRLRPLDLCEGMEVKPCSGQAPLVSPDTRRDYDCGNGPNRQDCPAGSYCHQTSHFAKCCKKDMSASLKSCEDSWYGCCPDSKTPALGSDNAGCPSMCGCNKLGSFSDTCDPISQQCSCKPGVGGLKCDRCEPGFWGLPKISEGHEGCIPCGCSQFGSVRDDCEQMTGRCVCKPGVHGQKCTVCTGENKVLGPGGCTSADSTTPVPTSCSELTCYFGAVCEEQDSHAKCVCRFVCSEDFDSMQAVCGNDGQTYGSECQLKLFACRYQKDIVVQALGPCKEEMFPGTDWPIKRSTAHRYTEPEDVSSPLYKSTRHLLVPEPPSHRFYYNSRPEETNSLTSASLHHLTRGKNLDNNIYYAAGYRPTPATIRVITALLGDLCKVDADCEVKYSQCVAGSCICKDGHAETPDRQECLANTPPLQPTVEFQACVSSPCHHGGSCIDLPQGQYRCQCTPQWTGAQCAEPLVQRAYQIPSFDGHSYVQLKRLKAYNKLSLEVEFMTYANDGIIIYNQQKFDGTGDFISLAIVNGYVEFRYNLGNGPVTITSLDRVEMKRFHRVVVKRYHRDGMLKLDDSEDVAGQSQGTLKALDLVEDAFVGYVPTNVTRVFENLGTAVGLTGCVRKLKIGRRQVELHEGYDLMVEKVVGVRECGENPCASLPCFNSGTCHALDSETYKCACTQEFTGIYCESRVNPCISDPCMLGSTCEALLQGGFVCKCSPGRKGKSCQDLDASTHDVFIPEFSGEAFLELPRLEGVGRAFSLQIWFMSRAEDGILLYNGQLTSGKGDFISVNLVKGHVQFKFDLGSGAANLTTAEAIALGEWHSAKVTRTNQEGTLQLDDGAVVRGSSTPPLNELNLELPLYVGGVPSLAEVNRDAAVVGGLKGAVQRLIINGQAWSLVEQAESGLVAEMGVTRYEGGPCPLNASPCANGGLCQPVLATYVCKCPMKYIGKHCEEFVQNNELPRPIQFTGETFYQYANKVSKSTNISFATNETNIEDDEYDVEEEEEDDEEPDENDETEEGIYTEYDMNEEGDMYDEDDIEFFHRGRKGERTNRYEITFRTTELHGLLLWMNKGRTLKGNYIAIAIVNGYVELCFNLGRQHTFLLIKSKVNVADGAWHTVVAQRRKRLGHLQVDDELPAKGVAERGATLLKTNGRLWIGGAPTLPSGLPASYYLGFSGCIEKIRVSKKLLDLFNRLGNDRSLMHFCHENDV